MRLFNFYITTIKHFEKMQARCDEVAWQRLRYMAHDERVQRAVLAASWSVLPEHISLAQDTSAVKGIIRALNEFVRQCDSVTHIDRVVTDKLAPKALGSDNAPLVVSGYAGYNNSLDNRLHDELSQVLERELGFVERNKPAQVVLVGDSDSDKPHLEHIMPQEHYIHPDYRGEGQDGPYDEWVEWREQTTASRK